MKNQGKSPSKYLTSKITRDIIGTNGGDVKNMTNKKDERVRFTFRLPQELMEKIKQAANKQGISLNAQILQILWEWKKKEEG